MCRSVQAGPRTVGAVYELEHGPYRASVSPIGAALAALTFDDRPLVLDTREHVAAGQVPMPAYSGVVLAPWPNRIRDGRYRLGDAELQLPITEVERGCALHGLLAWTRWDLVASDPSSPHPRGDRQPATGLSVHRHGHRRLRADRRRVGHRHLGPQRRPGRRPVRHLAAPLPRARRRGRGHGDLAADRDRRRRPGRGARAVAPALARCRPPAAPSTSTPRARWPGSRSTTPSAPHRPRQQR